MYICVRACRFTECIFVGRYWIRWYIFVGGLEGIYL
jgi:hypothetical protein